MLKLATQWCYQVCVNYMCVSVSVGEPVQTHNSSDAISLNSSYCCHRHVLPALPLLVPGKQRWEAFVQVDNGRNGSLRHSPSFHHSFPPVFSIPLGYLSLPCVFLSPFSCSHPSPFDLGVDQISTRDGRGEMTPPPLQPPSLGLA